MEKFLDNWNVMDRETFADTVRKVTELMIPPRQREFLELSGILDAMEGLQSRVVICSNQCEHLITRIQQQFSRIKDIRKPLCLQESQSISADLDRYLCNMKAAEDLLYLCADADWNLAALSVFPPASCDPSHSKFALAACDLDLTYFKLHSGLEPQITSQLEPIEPISSGQSIASNQDRSSVLHKLESRPSKKSVYRKMYDSLLRSRGSHHLDMYDALLRRRLQADASPSTPGSIPDCCWIPGKLEFSIVRVAGFGSSKSVLKCQWLGMDVAIAVYRGEHAKRELETEAGILASVQHPNVVTLFECEYDNELEEGHLVTELMEQDLSLLIRKRRGDGEMPFSVSVSKDIILQIVEAMIHMRQCRVLHRDLKPANCLVSAKKRLWQNNMRKTYYVVKLIDFGSAKVRGEGASTCHTRKQGTTAYMAPELHAMPHECAYNWSADVYSLGMTMYEILSGRFPFEGVYTGRELVRRVCAGERPLFPECIPGDWRELIENCWHRDPEQRYDFERVKTEIMLLSDQIMGLQNTSDEDEIIFDF